MNANIYEYPEDTKKVLLEISEKTANIKEVILRKRNITDFYRQLKVQIKDYKKFYQKFLLILRNGRKE